MKKKKILIVSARYYHNYSNFLETHATSFIKSKKIKSKIMVLEHKLLNLYRLKI